MIARNGPTCCQLLFTPLCLLFKRTLVWVILPQRGGDGRPLCASAWSEKPLTAPLDTAVPPFFQWLADFWRRSDNCDTFSPFAGTHQIFFCQLRAWSSSLCFPNGAFDLYFKGSLICCRKLGVEWASGAAVHSSGLPKGHRLPKSEKLVWETDN